MNINPLYVPVVKWKQGEHGALKELADQTKEKVIPLIEITPDLNEDKFKSTFNNWNNRPFYFDVVPECLDEDETIYFRLLEMCDCNFVIPVLYVYDDGSVISEAYNYSKIGIAFRITSEDSEDLTDNLNKILSVYQPNNIDLIIDLKELTPNNYADKNIILKSILSDIPKAHLFRNIILSSNSFPNTLSSIEKNKYCQIDRHDYSFWKNASKLNLKYNINLIYSDYCINHFSYTSYVPGMSPSFNIRYTTEDSYLILKGETVKKGGLDRDNVKRLCLMIVDSGYFKGSTFSWGDSYIDSRCEDIEGYGNLSTWRKVGTNHHIELVIDQLSNLP